MFLAFFLFSSLNLKASSLFVPDSDTGLLITLVGNTVQQLTRLEQLITETDKHTKLFRESVEMVEERYEVIDQLEAMASNYARIASSKPESLADVNDAIADLKDQREKLRDMIRDLNRTKFETDAVKSETKLVERSVNKDHAVAKKQIAKSFGAGKAFSRNMERINAQNTSLILKETVSLNGALNTTNGLLASQNNLQKIQVDQILNEGISKENALTPAKKRRMR